jgi:hypothetical protein
MHLGTLEVNAILQQLASDSGERSPRQVAPPMKAEFAGLLEPRASSSPSRHHQ